MGIFVKIFFFVLGLVLVLVAFNYTKTLYISEWLSGPLLWVCLVFVIIKIGLSVPGILIASAALPGSLLVQATFFVLGVCFVSGYYAMPEYYQFQDIVGTLPSPKALRTTYYRIRLPETASAPSYQVEYRTDAGVSDLYSLYQYSLTSPNSLNASEIPSRFTTVFGTLLGENAYYFKNGFLGTIRIGLKNKNVTILIAETPLSHSSVLINVQ